MSSSARLQNPKRRPINLSIREDILSEAKALKLNASKAAEAGIAAAIKQAREDNWLAENQDTIAAHNQRVAESGPLLVPDWADDNGAL
ncbi:type II toxin-antitoxin system CcdA family antitoxin [uncultured Parasphingorhabdus sp.]|uniref:type II toxin-antitoxin system CcdA family antitoxin n=1 Tax=uncultured Parasphingorhabdus sp. TaxID=2709694 RepID=UPI0030D9E476|tara:strand:+ start:16219 stop:16482 length:264 start_codon:yes stop_codon:yes gene_type:complete